MGALSLVSKKVKQLYCDSFLQEVTVNVNGILCLSNYLEKHPLDGSRIKTFEFDQVDSVWIKANAEKKKLVEEELIQFSTQLTSKDAKEDEAEIIRGTMIDGINKGFQCIIEKLVNLETLIIREPSIQFQISHGLNFLTSSLKKICIQSKVDDLNEGSYLSARNVIWILVFCESIERASLGFSLTISDVKYLSEFCETFQGLSRVDQLALSIHFGWDNDSETWWGLDSEEEDAEDRKASALSLLLSVTNELHSLEVHTYNDRDAIRDGDHSRLLPSFLDILYRSYHSLKYLSLFGVIPQLEFWTMPNLERFEGSTNLMVDANGLLMMAVFNDLPFPPNLSVISMLVYSHSPVGMPHLQWPEDDWLAKLLKNKTLTSLKEVVVSKEHLGMDARVKEWGTEIWQRNRAALEKLPIFQDGRVKLTKWSPGEIGEYSMSRCSRLSSSPRIELKFARR